MRKNTDRRTFLLAAGATATTVALAGCSGDDDDDGNGGEASVPDEVDSYLTDNNANGYDGGAVDQTGEDSITIENGAGDGFAFDPVAVRVDAGTEVTWEWTGEGGEHNVESADESDFEFRSGDPVDSADETYTETFDEAGNALYLCTPHDGAGMHAAIIVE